MVKAGGGGGVMYHVLRLTEGVASAHVIEGPNVSVLHLFIITESAKVHFFALPRPKKGELLDQGDFDAMETTHVEPSHHTIHGVFQILRRSEAECVAFCDHLGLRYAVSIRINAEDMANPIQEILPIPTLSDTISAALVTEDHATLSLETGDLLCLTFSGRLFRYASNGSYSSIGDTDTTAQKVLVVGGECFVVTDTCLLYQLVHRHDMRIVHCSHRPCALVTNAVSVRSKKGIALLTEGSVYSLELGQSTMQWCCISGMQRLHSVAALYKSTLIALDTRGKAVFLDAFPSVLVGGNAAMSAIMETLESRSSQLDQLKAIEKKLDASIEQQMLFQQPGFMSISSASFILNAHGQLLLAVGFTFSAEPNAMDKDPVLIRVLNAAGDLMHTQCSDLNSLLTRYFHIEMDAPEPAFIELRLSNPRDTSKSLHTASVVCRLRIDATVVAVPCKMSHVYDMSLVTPWYAQHCDEETQKPLKKQTSVLLLGFPVLSYSDRFDVEEEGVSEFIQVCGLPLVENEWVSFSCGRIFPSIDIKISASQVEGSTLIASVSFQSISLLLIAYFREAFLHAASLFPARCANPSKHPSMIRKNVSTSFWRETMLHSCFPRLRAELGGYLDRLVSLEESGFDQTEAREQGHQRMVHKLQQIYHNLRNEVIYPLPL